MSQLFPLECNSLKAGTLVLFIKMSQVPGTARGTRKMLNNIVELMKWQFHLIRAFKKICARHG